MSKYKIKVKMTNCGDAYGISITLPDGRIEVYSDVTQNRTAMQEFIEKVNRGNVSQVHIEELIEDFIG